MSEVFVVHAPFVGVDFPSGVFQNLEDAMRCVRELREELHGHQEQIDVYKYIIGIHYNDEEPTLVHTSKI